MTSDLRGNWEQFVGQFKLHVDNMNEFSYVFNLHTHTDTHVLQLSPDFLLQWLQC